MLFLHLVIFFVLVWFLADSFSLWNWDSGGNMNRYSSICRMVQKLVNTVKQMDPKDPFRVDMTDKLLEKL